jgi:hypothetical protein
MRTTLFAEPDADAATTRVPQARCRDGAEGPRRVRAPRGDVRDLLVPQALPGGGMLFVLTTSAPLTDHDLRDLARFARVAQVEVRFRIPSTDRRLAAVLDPTGPAPPLRFAGLRAARRAGLRAGVLIAPLVPGVNGIEVELRDLLVQSRASDSEFVESALDLPGPDRAAALLGTLRGRYPRVAARYEVWLRTAARSSGEDRGRVEALLADLGRRFRVPVGSRPGAAPHAPAPPWQRTFAFAS